MTPRLKIQVGILVVTGVVLGISIGLFISSQLIGNFLPELAK